MSSMDPEQEVDKLAEGSRTTDPEASRRDSFASSTEGDLSMEEHRARDLEAREVVLTLDQLLDEMDKVSGSLSDSGGSASGGRDEEGLRPVATGGGKTATSPGDSLSSYSDIAVSALPDDELLGYDSKESLTSSVSSVGGRGEGEEVFLSAEGIDQELAEDSHIDQPLILIDSAVEMEEEEKTEKEGKEPEEKETEEQNMVGVELEGMPVKEQHGEQEQLSPEQSMDRPGSSLSGEEFIPVEEVQHGSLETKPSLSDQPEAEGYPALPKIPEEDTSPQPSRKEAEAPRGTPSDRFPGVVMRRRVSTESRQDSTSSSAAGDDQSIGTNRYSTSSIETVIVRQPSGEDAPPTATTSTSNLFAPSRRASVYDEWKMEQPYFPTDEDGEGVSVENILRIWKRRSRLSEGSWSSLDVNDLSDEEGHDEKRRWSGVGDGLGSKRTPRGSFIRNSLLAEGEGIQEEMEKELLEEMEKEMEETPAKRLSHQLPEGNVVEGWKAIMRQSRENYKLINGKVQPGKVQQIPIDDCGFYSD